MSSQVISTRSATRAAMIAVLLLLVLGGPAWGAESTRRAARVEVYSILPLGNRVWVGTSDGLRAHRRSDGTFEFRIDDSMGLPSSVVRALHPLNEERIAVGTDRGAVVVDTTASGPDAARVWKVRDTERTFVAAWTRWKDRTLLLDFEHGIGDLVGGDDAWAAWSPAPMAGGMWSSVALYEQTLLLGGLDGIIGLYGYEAAKRYAFDDGSRGRLEIEQPVLAMAAAATGVAIATGDELLWWEHGRIEPIRRWDAAQSLPIHAVSVASDRTSQVWVGTRDGEIWLLGAAGPKQVSDVHRRIAALAPDGEYVWLGLSGGELRRVRVDTKPGA